jgi:eukaryotic-like serine/threonine-protein kinase
MTTVQRPDPVHLARFTVGDWLVDPRACVASRGETTEKLRPQLVDLLVCLAKRPGRIVLKQEILDDVWSGQFTAESGLSRCVAELRQILRDDAQQPTFIETIPKRGYRLIAPVAWLDEAPPAPAAPDQSAPEDPLASVAGAGGPAPVDTRRLSRRRWMAWTGVGLAVLAVGIASVVLLTMRQRMTVLTERDTVLLADVSNATGDRVFDDALRLALAVNLEQAPFLRILPQDAVRAALVRSGRSPDARVVGPIALEVCRREGAAVLLAGSIASLGSRYVVGIEAVACGSGESLGRVMTEAGSKERVLTALEQAASRIRQRLGESRDSLRQHDVPLVRATTPSLDALKALTLGDVRRDAGRYAEALTHYRQATELDPQFALAWARRGLSARNVDLREEAIPALRRAFELKDRVSQPERFFIEGLYYCLVAGDPEKAIEIFQAWKRMYPGSPIPSNYIAATRSDELGQYEAAIEEAREAVRLGPNTSWSHNNLAQACMGAGRFADAKKVIGEATSRGIDDLSMHAYLFIIALAEQDQASIERETRWAAGDPQTSLVWMRLRAAAAVTGGRLAEARRLWQEALATANELGSREVADVRLDQAEAEALVGDPILARAAASAAVAVDRRTVSLVRSAIVFAMAGDPARVRPLLDDAARRVAADPAPLRVWLPVAEALVAAREGRPDDALRILQPTARVERGNNYALYPLGVRALVSLSARRPADAAAAFEDLVRLGAIIGNGPWVAAARLGLARALRDSDDAPRSLAAYDAFLDSWKGADPDAPLLKAAQRERASVAVR